MCSPTKVKSLFVTIYPLYYLTISEAQVKDTSKIALLYVMKFIWEFLHLYHFTVAVLTVLSSLGKDFFMGIKILD